MAVQYSIVAVQYSTVTVQCSTGTSDSAVRAVTATVQWQYRARAGKVAAGTAVAVAVL